MNRPPIVKRLLLRNYKSIKACDVRVPRLMFLVGPNGAGKSNFLDGLRFVSDSLQTTLDHALRDRGGIKEVRRSSTGHPTHIGIRIEFQLSETSWGHFAFDLGARPSGAYVVQQEECHVCDVGSGTPTWSRYRIVAGELSESTIRHAPAAAGDRLYLVNVSGTTEFRGVYEALGGMGFYNLNPSAIRELQPPDPGHLLARDGSNIASVLGTLASEHPKVKRRIEEYLEKVVPGIVGVDGRPVGPRETLQFLQASATAKEPRKFFAASMSDGTLRALGVLVALFQGVGDRTGAARLIGIEEPAAALHPAAASILVDSITDACEHAQVIVTSHSPELLEHESIGEESVFAVVSEDGNTVVGALDEPGRAAMQSHLYTAGELLRMDQIRPHRSAWETTVSQLQLFEAESAG